MENGYNVSSAARFRGALLKAAWSIGIAALSAGPVAIVVYVLFFKTSLI